MSLFERNQFLDDLVYPIDQRSRYLGRRKKLTLRSLRAADIGTGGVTMSKRGALGISVFQPSIISMAYRILAMVLLAALPGCSEEGTGGPVISGPSASAGMSAGLSLEPTAGYTQTHLTEHLLSTPLSTDTSTDFLLDLTPDPLPYSGSSDDAVIAAASTPMGVTVRLKWEQSPNVDTSGYTVYFGRQPALEPGSCAGYEASLAVDRPPATITDLNHETVYYFAVKNFDDPEDACSEEIMVVTPPAHIQLAAEN